MKSHGLRSEGADADIALQIPSTITQLEELMLVIPSSQCLQKWDETAVPSLLAQSELHSHRHRAKGSARFEVYQRFLSELHIEDDRRIS